MSENIIYAFNPRKRRRSTKSRRKGRRGRRNPEAVSVLNPRRKGYSKRRRYGSRNPISIKKYLPSSPKEMIGNALYATLGSVSSIALPNRIGRDATGARRPGWEEGSTKDIAVRILSAILAGFTARKIAKKENAGIAAYSGGMGMVGLRLISGGVSPIVDKVAGAGTGLKVRSAFADLSEEDLEEELTEEAEEAMGEELDEEVEAVDQELGAGPGLVTSDIPLE